jgi:hypothetical protein
MICLICSSTQEDLSIESKGSSGLEDVGSVDIEAVEVDASLSMSHGRNDGFVLSPTHLPRFEFDDDSQEFFPAKANVPRIVHMHRGRQQGRLSPVEKAAKKSPTKSVANTQMNVRIQTKSRF